MKVEYKVNQKLEASKEKFYTIKGTKITIHSCGELSYYCYMIGDTKFIKDNLSNRYYLYNNY